MLQYQILDEFGHRIGEVHYLRVDAVREIKKQLKIYAYLLLQVSTDGGKTWREDERWTQ